MRVIYQDCGCVALPDEIVSALGLTPGTAIDISYLPVLKAAMLVVADPQSDQVAGASCRIRASTA